MRQHETPREFEPAELIVGAAYALVLLISVLAASGMVA
jgi:hypothetical protein